MRLTNQANRKFFNLTVCFFAAQLAAHSQVAANPMQQLVEISARRLVIAEQVALAKWDSGAAVEDSERETQVIANATKAGEAMGLDREEVANFFRAQIEANKLVQYALLAEWRRAGQAPAHKPVDLKETIRPQLDQLETQILAELAKTKAVRESASCSTKVAQEVGKYVLTNKGKLSELETVALDRAMAQTCDTANR
jgi:chorismate mutase